MNVFTNMFKISTAEAGECEMIIRMIHASYPQYGYKQVLDGCYEMCSRHPEPSLVTLKHIHTEITLFRQTSLTDQKTLDSMMSYSRQLESIIMDEERMNERNARA